MCSIPSVATLFESKRNVKRTVLASLFIINWTKLQSIITRLKERKKKKKRKGKRSKCEKNKKQFVQVKHDANSSVKRETTCTGHSVSNELSSFTNPGVSRMRRGVRRLEMAVAWREIRASRKQTLAFAKSVGYPGSRDTGR